MKKLSRSFYARDTVAVAQDLLGHYLIRRHEDMEQIVRIVEVEAYLGPADLASHASKGLTKRTKPMFGPPGHAYVYMIYGMYYCTNIVTEAEGSGTAVLLRAAEPIKNIADRTQGPGLLSKALSIDKSLNETDLCGTYFYLAKPDEITPFTIVKRPRIGVHYARSWAEKPLRFYIKDNAYVSKT